MAIVKLQSRGQLTLPKSVRKTLGAKPGDTLLINPTGEGRAEIAKLEPMTFECLLERFHIEGPIDWHKMREEAEAAAAQEFMRKVREFEGFGVDVPEVLPG